MIKKAMHLVERHPGQAALMGAGLIAGVLVARQLADDERRAALRSQIESAVGQGSGHGSGSGSQSSPVSMLSAISPRGGWSAPSLPQKLGIREKTVAVFLATFLAKSLAGYFRWRSEQRALETGMQAQQTPSAAQESLNEMTVAELRVAASEREVEGRSSMNKSELVEALNSQD